MNLFLEWVSGDLWNAPLKKSNDNFKLSCSKNKSTRERIGSRNSDRGYLSWATDFANEASRMMLHIPSLLFCPIVKRCFSPLKKLREIWSTEGFVGSCEGWKEKQGAENSPNLGFFLGIALRNDVAITTDCYEPRLPPTIPQSLTRTSFPLCSQELADDARNRY